MENVYLKMMIILLDILKMDNIMVMEDLFSLQEIIMKGNGKMVYVMEMEYM